MTATGSITGSATPAAAAAPRRPAGRQKVGAALLAAAGAGLILASVGRGWAEATVTSPVRLSVHATGNSITSLPYALGLAALAGAVALFAVRRVGRYLVGLVLLGAGLGTAAAVATNLGHLDSTRLARAAEQTLGAEGAQLGGVTNTAWPYVSLFGGLLVALAGGYTLARGHSWTGLSNRYEAPVAAAAAGATGAAGPAAAPGGAAARDDAAHAEPSTRELWDSLNHGTDPTL
ncbi:Trp biosynthesis-associated membrane protein [Actinocrinis puniceicyclus]|uniref:Trp biosynthesis-associated membrane protein n=1 Tax=Actinocrinis puniceicyclus TaxID=977794 RepID=A0A8J8BA92_9ACTN|nr:Trp biosynthesis-associated membrane protein [Actinocrinis puniceicyclus]MBS2962707.1 Trp biosynthesis-associated membrane protein [Actinocrinis puniceicyclus]